MCRLWCSMTRAVAFTGMLLTLTLRNAQPTRRQCKGAWHQCSCVCFAGMAKNLIDLFPCYIWRYLMPQRERRVKRTDGSTRLLPQSFKRLNRRFDTLYAIGRRLQAVCPSQSSRWLGRFERPWRDPCDGCRGCSCVRTAPGTTHCRPPVSHRTLQGCGRQETTAIGLGSRRHLQHFER